MRKLLPFVVVLAACGSSGGGGGGGAPAPLTGRVAGRDFTPVEVRAVLAGSGATPCSVPFGGSNVDVGMSTLALEVTSYANACADFASAACTFHKNAQLVTVLIARLNGLATEPAIGTGTYTVTASPAQLQGSAPLFTVAYGEAIGLDPTTCATTVVSGTVGGGTVQLTQTTGPVTGRLALSFQDGSTLSGDFSAPICPGVSIDVCGLATQAIATGGVPSVCSLSGATCGP